MPMLCHRPHILCISADTRMYFVKVGVALLMHLTTLCIPITVCTASVQKISMLIEMYASFWLYT